MSTNGDRGVVAYRRHARALRGADQERTSPHNPPLKERKTRRRLACVCRLHPSGPLSPEEGPRTALRSLDRRRLYYRGAMLKGVMVVLLIVSIAIDVYCLNTLAPVTDSSRAHSIAPFRM